MLAAAFILADSVPAFALRGMQLEQQGAGLEELGGRLRENGDTPAARLMNPEALTELLGPREDLTTEARLMLLYADPDGLKAYLRTLPYFRDMPKGKQGGEGKEFRAAADRIRNLIPGWVLGEFLPEADPQLSLQQKMRVELTQLNRAPGAEGDLARGLAEGDFLRHLSAAVDPGTPRELHARLFADEAAVRALLSQFPGIPTLDDQGQQKTAHRVRAILRDHALRAKDPGDLQGRLEQALRQLARQEEGAGYLLRLNEASKQAVLVSRGQAVRAASDESRDPELEARGKRRWDWSEGLARVLAARLQSEASPEAFRAALRSIRAGFNPDPGARSGESFKQLEDSLLPSFGRWREGLRSPLPETRAAAMDSLTEQVFKAFHPDLARTLEAQYEESAGDPVSSYVPIGYSEETLLRLGELQRQGYSVVMLDLSAHSPQKGRALERLYPGTLQVASCRFRPGDGSLTWYRQTDPARHYDWTLPPAVAPAVQAVLQDAEMGRVVNETLEARLEFELDQLEADRVEAAQGVQRSGWVGKLGWAASIGAVALAAGAAALGGALMHQDAPSPAVPLLLAQASPEPAPGLSGDPGVPDAGRTGADAVDLVRETNQRILDAQGSVEDYRVKRMELSLQSAERQAGRGMVSPVGVRQLSDEVEALRLRRQRTAAEGEIVDNRWELGLLHVPRAGPRIEQPRLPEPGVYVQAPDSFEGRPSGPTLVREKEPEEKGLVAPAEIVDPRMDLRTRLPDALRLLPEDPPPAEVAARVEDLRESTAHIRNAAVDELRIRAEQMERDADIQEEQTRRLYERGLLDKENGKRDPKVLDNFLSPVRVKRAQADQLDIEADKLERELARMQGKVQLSKQGYDEILDDGIEAHRKMIQEEEREIERYKKDLEEVRERRERFPGRNPYLDQWVEDRQRWIAVGEESIESLRGSIREHEKKREATAGQAVVWVDTTQGAVLVDPVPGRPLYDPVVHRLPDASSLLRGLAPRIRFPDGTEQPVTPGLVEVWLEEPVFQSGDPGEVTYAHPRDKEGADKEGYEAQPRIVLVKAKRAHLKDQSAPTRLDFDWPVLVTGPILDGRLESGWYKAVLPGYSPSPRPLTGPGLLWAGEAGSPPEAVVFFPVFRVELDEQLRERSAITHVIPLRVPADRLARIYKLLTKEGPLTAEEQAEIPRLKKDAAGVWGGEGAVALPVGEPLPFDFRKGAVRVQYQVKVKQVPNIDKPGTHAEPVFEPAGPETMPIPDAPVPPRPVRQVSPPSRSGLEEQGGLPGWAGEFIDRYPIARVDLAGMEEVAGQFKILSSA